MWRQRSRSSGSNNSSSIFCSFCLSSSSCSHSSCGQLRVQCNQRAKSAWPNDFPVMPAPKENIIKQGKLGRRQQEKESTSRRSRSRERVEAAARKEQEEQWKKLKQSERTRTRRGLHYQIERLPLPPPPLLLLLQTCFRFRLQCPSEIVEEAAQIQQPLVRYIKL